MSPVSRAMSRLIVTSAFVGLFGTTAMAQEKPSSTVDEFKEDITYLLNNNPKHIKDTFDIVAAEKRVTLYKSEYKGSNQTRCERDQSMANAFANEIISLLDDTHNDKGKIARKAKSTIKEKLNDFERIAKRHTQIRLEYDCQSGLVTVVGFNCTQ